MTFETQTTLLHGDCLELMKHLPDKSVDFILTDPPYGTTACKWDSVIPFEPMWTELNRVIKDNGAIALFGSEPFSSALRMSNIKMFKYDWIWEKTLGTGNMNANKMPIKKHEIISIFYKKLPIYNPQFSKGTPYKDSRGLFGKRSKNEIYGSAVLRYSPINNKGVRYPISVVKFSNPNNNKHHPTMKPKNILEYLIKTYTNEHETVLDFTMGSGSTGVAAKNLNRSFIGIEKDDFYFKVAQARIAGDEELLAKLKEEKKSRK